MCDRNNSPDTESEMDYTESDTDDTELETDDTESETDRSVRPTIGWVRNLNRPRDGIS